MFGVAEMREIRQAVGAYAGGFDPALVTAGAAQRIVEEAAAAENMLATVKALAAERVSKTDLWRKEGDASPAHQLARKSGTSVGKAREALETAGRLAGLPEVDAAARRGELSPAQAAPIAEAASLAPRTEQRLLAAAKSASLGELLDACARTKAAARPDDEARHRAIHASRFLRRRRTADGAGELLYRSTLEEVAEIFAIVQGWADRRFRAARAENRHSSGEAYLADGLLDAVRASRVTGGDATTAGGARPAGRPPAPGATDPGPNGLVPETDVNAAAATASSSVAGADIEAEAAAAGPNESVTDGCSAGAARELFTDAPRPVDDPVGSSQVAPAAAGGRAAVANGPPRPPSPAKVIFRVDWDAFIRGWPLDGEVCEIAGLGPVPVSAVRQMIDSGDAVLAAVVTKGVDVVNVAHLGRRPTAHQQTALDWRSPSCTTLGCNASMRLENDHRADWAETKVTLLAGIDPLCGRCHDRKTYKGWALVEGTGKRPMVPPDDARHPRNVRPEPGARHGPDAA